MTIYVRCPVCGSKTTAYSERHLASIRKLRHRERNETRRPWCTGTHEVIPTLAEWKAAKPPQETTT